MNKKILALLMVSLILPLCGCINPPVTEKDGEETPLNAIKIVPYVSKTYQYYSGYISLQHDGWGSGGYEDHEATQDFFWLDIRNVGRNDLNGIKIWFTNLPNNWALYDIEARSESSDTLKLTFDKNTNEIVTLYAQHNEKTDEWHTEQETTLMLRFRVSTGIKGGYDYTNDGFPDSLVSDDPSYSTEGIEVGYFPRSWYIHFHVLSDEGAQADVKLDVEITEDKTKDLRNAYSPWEYRSDA